MLAAYDMGLSQSGEYVFFDVELFDFPGRYWGDHRYSNSFGPAMTAYGSLNPINKKS
jgi:atrial natriuretic peptide receptor A